MIKNLIKRWKAVKALLTSAEYFLTVTNQKNPYGPIELGPIVYDYIDNTDREMFYVFVKSWIKDNKIYD